VCGRPRDARPEPHRAAPLLPRPRLGPGHQRGADALRRCARSTTSPPISANTPDSTYSASPRAPSQPAGRRPRRR
jgi:hypothetical protein